MGELPFSHVSVLLSECIDALQIREGRTYIDCTTGGGGHSYEIAARLPAGSRLLCLDRDTDALAAAGKRLAPFADKVTLIHSNFADLPRVLDQYQVTDLGGVLMDLGCSSFQLDNADRGFSYMQDAPLDMRMDRQCALDAHTVVNSYEEAALCRILYEYGEERYAPRIAAAICRQRELSPINTTGQLAELVKAAMPMKARAEAQHPAKRTFQAIRIEVNGELAAIAPTVDCALRAMVPGGRLAVISFHSLEDRAVKQTVRQLSSGCECPPDFPVCVCGKKPLCRSVTKKPILPTQEELEVNPRSRSAKLRVAERLPL